MDTDEQDGRKQTRTTAERTVVSYRICVHLYYKDETLCTAGKNLECGDLSPLLPLGRLVAKAGPPPAARESWTPSRIRRRQVACRKRGQVRALQSGCRFAARAFCASLQLATFVFDFAVSQTRAPFRVRWPWRRLRSTGQQAGGSGGR